MSNSTKIKTSYLFSIISVALVLILLGFFGMLVLHTNGFINYFKEQINIIVEIKNDAEQGAAHYLEDQLTKEAFVKLGTIKYIPKKEAIELLKKDFGEDFLSYGFNNPLYDVITFNVNADYMQPDQLKKLRNDLIENNPVISDVYYQENMIDTVMNNLSKIGWFSLFVSLLFVLVAITLIHYTVRLALFSNRLLIKNMELIGASWEFISKPYIVQSIKNGLISSIIAISVLLLLLLWARNDLPELALIQPNSNFVLLFLGLIILGVLITGLSTYYVVNKYLKMRMDDLY